jgi:hypothetical protein
LLAEVLTVLSPVPASEGSGDKLRLAYFALVFSGSLVILPWTGLRARATLGGTVPVHLYVREAMIYGAVMLLAPGTSCWLVAEWSRQFERSVT